MEIAPVELSTGILLVGIAVAGAYDLAIREVPDNVWRVMGGAGAVVVGFVVAEDGGALQAGLWALAAAYGLQSFFPWTDRLAGPTRRREALVEGLLGAGALAVVVVAVARLGVGPAGVPYVVVATLAVSLGARALYEVGILIGGADAKALVAMGLVLPIFPAALIVAGPLGTSFLQAVPFAFNALIDAALLSLVVPIAIAARNLRAQEFRWRGGFTSFSLAVSDLPARYVWIDDPTVFETDEGLTPESSEGDRALRERVASALTAQGRTTVRVTPQLPFVFLLALGAAAAVLAGNLLWTLVTVL